jgi:hypothetical protein
MKINFTDSKTSRIFGLSALIVLVTAGVLLVPTIDSIKNTKSYACLLEDIDGKLRCVRPKKTWSYASLNCTVLEYNPRDSKTYNKAGCFCGSFDQRERRRDGSPRVYGVGCSPTLRCLGSRMSNGRMVGGWTEKFFNSPKYSGQCVPKPKR